MNKLKPLLPYLGRYRWTLFVGIFYIFVTAILGLLSPLVIGRAIDALYEDITRRTLLWYGLVIIAISAIRGIFQFLQRKVLVTMSRCIEFDLLNEVFSHLESLHQGFFQKSSTGDLMARSTNDMQAVRMLCGPAIMYGSNTVFIAIGALIFMANIHLGMTLVAIIVLPLVAIVTRVFGSRIHVLFDQVQATFSEISTKVQENLAGARVVRAYAQESAEEEVFATLNREYVNKNRQLILWHSAFSPFLQSLVGFSLAAVLWYGGRILIAGEITVGEFVAFNLFLGQLTWPMIAIGWVINIVERGSASLLRIRQVLDEEPTICDQEPLLHNVSVRGAVAFKHLGFTYPETDTPVLHDIDFEIDKGQTVALVGRTGAGKSTLLSLIPRLIDPPDGQLAIDGHEVRNLPLQTLRSAIAMVPQETLLFSATIRHNISFGHPDASEEEVQQAAALAGLENDLASFPLGLETIVGERGVTLSGGQKQRVALARALIREPRIMLLDDCLSAVDTQTEEHILSNLRTVFPGRTVLLVSHRISTAQLADWILVLDRGRIAERGTHQQLIAHGGIYADLYRRQQLEEQLAAV